MSLFLAFAAVTVSLSGVVALGARSAALRAGGLALALAVTYAGGADLLGRPKPARLALIEQMQDEARLVGSYYVEGKAIWLWLLWPDAAAPMAYALPWDRRTAEALMKARRQAEADGAQVMVRRPFRDGPRAEPIFRVPPLPPMPSKE